VAQLLIYEMDTTKIQGNRDFQCPKCGATILPDDKTDEVYCILEKKVRNKSIIELIIQCQKCKSKIRLIGLLILNINEN
jgi:DNA-directed RNA polymerase subunit RPC12/RpoP